MVPSRVDTNRKQARSSIDQVEEDLFSIDRMARTVSVPSQAPVHLAKMSPRDFYYKCLDEGDARQCSIPTLRYAINMQQRLLHGGRDDLILSAIQAKSRSKSGHQRNSCQILQNRATESRRACAELVPKLLLRIPLYVDFLILIPLCHMSMSIIASSAYLLGP
jgi:hypothetical protein